jgi:hypothetical protein
MLNIKKIDLLIFLLSFLIILSFVFGFYLDENSAGAGDSDFKLIWNNQQIFLENKIKDAIVHGGYFDSRTPISYILHKYLNPFTNSIESFRKTVFIISSILPIVFFFSLKKKFDTKIPLLILLSSFILMSPFFRTTSYWGLEENYGMIFLVLTNIIILNYEKISSHLQTNYKKISSIFLICFFSSMTFYFDQKLIIVPILSLIFILKNFENREKLLALIIFFFFSLPYIYLIFLWGAPIATTSSSRAFTFNWINPGYIMCIIGFYIFPFIFFKNKNLKDLKKFFLNKVNIFIILITATYLLSFLFSHDFNNVEPTIGNGIGHKVANFFFDDILLKKFTIILFIFFSTLTILFFFSTTHDRLIILFFLSLGLIVNPIYQEYFDPLIFIMLFTFFKEKIIINYRLLGVMFLYFSSILVSAIYYYRIVLY